MSQTRKQRIRQRLRNMGEKIIAQRVTLSPKVKEALARGDHGRAMKERHTGYIWH